MLAGTGDFVLGGILSGAADLGAMGTLGPTLLLGLFVFGIGKAALMPVHPWLPNAMVAPTPVSAFLHAVAVVKAGVFGVLKVSLYVFGTDYLAETGASDLFVWIAAASILIASAVAMTQDNLKARLAYSTVSQLSYVTLGAMLATSLGVIGAATQIAAHALGKMTLFMCAGAIYTGAHHSLISEMRGTGQGDAVDLDGLRDRRVLDHRAAPDGRVLAQVPPDDRQPGGGPRRPGRRPDPL